MSEADQLVVDSSSPSETRPLVDGDQGRESPLPAEGAEERTFDRWAIDRRTCVLIVAFSLTFLVQSHLPLSGGRFWGDLAIGRWILDHGRLPDHDPLVPLVEGVPVIPTRWMFQVGGAWWGAIGGDESFTYLFAFVSLAGAVLFVDACRKAGGSLNGAILSFLGLTALSIGIPRLNGADLIGWGIATLGLWFWAVQIRSLNLKANAATMLGSPFPGDGLRGPISLPAGRITSALIAWAVTPCLFACWANLHESFGFGLAFLACQAMGSGLEVRGERDSRSRREAAARFHRNLVMCELACLGALCNPTGIDLLLERCGLLTLVHETFARDAFPLRPGTWSGLTFAVLLVMGAVLIRRSRLPIATGDALAAMAFVGFAAFDVTAIQFSLPVLLFLAAPHLADVLGCWVRTTDSSLIQGLYGSLFHRSIRLTMIAAPAIWFGFVFSPLSRLVLGGKPRSPEQYLRSDIPSAGTAALLKHQPQGMVAAPADWGDWLSARGPRNAEVMLTTHSQEIAPRQVRDDFEFLMQGRPGLDRILERYRINAVLADVQRQGQLIEAMDRLTGWKRVYAEGRCSLFLRDGSAEPETEGSAQAAGPQESET